MKKAVLYARVSGDLQAKEGTIESQVLALKQQIATAGHLLVKQYIDNCFSGPRLDRPGLDELRHDLRTSLFDVIYFLDADRIDARHPLDPKRPASCSLRHRFQSSKAGGGTKPANSRSISSASFSGVRSSSHGPRI